MSEPKQECRLCFHEMLYGCCTVDTCKCICEAK